MRKILNNVLLLLILVAMLFTLTACGAKEEEVVATDDVEINEEVINEEENIENEEEDIDPSSFNGIYVGKSTDDYMEGLAIMDFEYGKLILFKDTLGRGISTIGDEHIHGNYIEKEFRNEIYKITDAGENIKFTHPIFTLGDEVELVPAIGEFTGIYKDDIHYLVVFKTFNDEIVVAYLESKYENISAATLADYTVTGNTIEGKDDAYNEPMKLVFDGDKLTFTIETEDHILDRANREYTKVK